MYANVHNVEPKGILQVRKLLIEFSYVILVPRHGGGAFSSDDEVTTTITSHDNLCRDVFNGHAFTGYLLSNCSQHAGSDDTDKQSQRHARIYKKRLSTYVSHVPVFPHTMYTKTMNRLVVFPCGASRQVRATYV